MEPKLSSIAENDFEPLVLLPLLSKHGDGGYVLSYLVGGTVLFKLKQVK